MHIQTLLQDYTDSPLPDISVTGLALDSRAIETGYAFIALAGAKQHGLTHLSQAIARGAVLCLYEAEHIDTAPVADIPLIAIAQLKEKLGYLADRFYQQPSHALSVIGITGTNGKTSTSQFLAQCLDACGIIGTLGWGHYGQLRSTLNTTPDALAVHSQLAQLKNEGCQQVAMEVSSHGLHQGRVNGVRFTGAVFTNISRDHLDYHGTMDDYVQAKALLLQSPDLQFAVINLDDAYSEQLIAVLPAKVQLWGISRQGKYAPFGETLHASASEHSHTGLRFTVRWREQTQVLSSPLYGDFNVDNVLSVLAVLLALGMNLDTAQKRIAQLKAVTGRMERFGSDAQPLVFVDYAHTPDALEKVLSSVRPHCRGQLSVVFGCGGNRDAGKRPLMGAIAQRLADKVIITDDNPRDENSADIMQAILAGCPQKEKIQLIANRASAINSAIQQANAQDCIVIAGKGHEDYQEVKGIKSHFSDAEHVITALAKI